MYEMRENCSFRTGRENGVGASMPDGEVGSKGRDVVDAGVVVHTVVIGDVRWAAKHVEDGGMGILSIATPGSTGTPPSAPASPSPARISSKGRLMG